MMCSNGDKAFYSIADNRGGGGFWQLLREATPAAPLPPKLVLQTQTQHKLHCLLHFKIMRKLNIIQNYKCIS